MKIQWLGTASLLVEAGNSRVLIDPYLRKLNKKLKPVLIEGECEAIFITHPHFDHFSDAEKFLSSGAKKLYVSENGIALAQKNGISVEKMFPLAANQEVRAGEIIVKAYQSRHCKFDAATVLSIALNPKTYLRLQDSIEILKLMKRFKIKDDIYALEISAEGKKIVLLGSAGMARGVAYPQGCDLFVFPYQGRAGMHRQLAPFLEAFCPKAVMLDHFDDAFPPFTHNIDTKKFIPAVKKALPSARAFVPEEGKWYEV